MPILNFILKFRTSILTEKLLLHLFTGTETLNSDKSDSNQCYSESESATAHQQQICTTKSVTQTEPRMKSWRGLHVGLMPIPLWLRSSCFSSPSPFFAPPMFHPFPALLFFFLPSKLVAWHSGRTSVSGRRTFPVLRSTCS